MDMEGARLREEVEVKFEQQHEEVSLIRARMEQMEARLDADVQRWHDHGHIPDMCDTGCDSMGEGSGTTKDGIQNEKVNVNEQVAINGSDGELASTTRRHVRHRRREEELLETPMSWANRTETALEKEEKKDGEVVNGRPSGIKDMGLQLGYQLNRGNLEIMDIFSTNINMGITSNCRWE